MNKSEQSEETIIASRVPRSYVLALDRLVDGKTFWTRSDLVRQAILDYLGKTRPIWTRVQAEPRVNPTERDDEVSRSLRELIALQSK